MIILALVTEDKRNWASAAHEKDFFPKFRIEDKVFILHNYKIHKGIIVRVDCSRELDRPKPKETVLYTLELPEIKGTVQLPEDLCFESKEALKDSL